MTDCSQEVKDSTPPDQISEEKEETVKDEVPGCVQLVSQFSPASADRIMVEGRLSECLVLSLCPAFVGRSCRHS